MRELAIRRLGLVPYEQGVALQADLVERRRRGAVADTLLLLEHPHVITLGVRTHRDRAHVIATTEHLAARGVTVQESGRGGDVTYHGPGQLVGYPIIELPPERRDLHRYVRDLEESLIGAIRRFGIEAGRVSGRTGVWVGDEKIAAIGVRISRWVTSHGFALNVTTDLGYFDLIIPCGISDRGVTSMERLLGVAPGLENVQDAVVDAFSDVFGFQAHPEVPA
jgi:lipoyl(octanoyl) transferase